MFMKICVKLEIAFCKLTFQQPPKQRWWPWVIPRNASKILLSWISFQILKFQNPLFVSKCNLRSMRKWNFRRSPEFCYFNSWIFYRALLHGQIFVVSEQFHIWGLQLCGVSQQCSTARKVAFQLLPRKEKDLHSECFIGRIERIPTSFILSALLEEAFHHCSSFFF